MILERFRRYVSEPLYHSSCYGGDELSILKYGVRVCEKRILEIVSAGRHHPMEPNMESFPWNEMEEILGEHLQKALTVHKKIQQLSQINNQVVLPNIFSLYSRWKKIYY